ncbi:MAG: hypothetical protein HKN25_13970 [Pyrinomonadaceae bacterium]|nr:hypothetical protein [Pyrinomonadaceae bacterium]
MRTFSPKISAVTYTPLLLILLSAFLFFPQTARAQALHNCLSSVQNWQLSKISRKKTPAYWIDPGFSTAEQKFVKEALSKAVRRIQKKSIWREVNSSYRFAYPKNKTIANSGLCNNLSVKRNLLFHQLNFISSESTGQFPKIYIYRRNIAPKKGSTGWLGYAYYDRVSVFWDYASRRWRRSGNFQLYLNQHFLRRNGIYKSSDFWAGTIAHEMLHNLGHQHPNAKDKRYRTFQINVMADAIRRYGPAATAGEIEYPVHQCRLKAAGEATAGHIE